MSSNTHPAELDSLDSAPGEVTRLLANIEADEGLAASRLLDLVYHELHRMAAVRMAGECPDHTLQPTALVHEAWLRLVGDGSTSFANRAHFFSVAAQAMRRILIESARRRLARKRGGGLDREELQERHLVHHAPSEELIAVHEAVEELRSEDPVAARLVDLRYFVGLNMEDAAHLLGISLRSAERSWTYARAWLKRQLATTGPIE